jgi:hypothetical protein
MDFITDLPASILFKEVEHNVILVVVDHFTKIGYFIPTWKDITTKQLIELFIYKVVYLYGLPSDIMTDQRSIFISKF